jgi:hypothetical protein
VLRLRRRFGETTHRGRTIGAHERFRGGARTIMPTVAAPLE